VAGELVLREDRTGPVPLAFLSPESCAAWLEPTFAETGSILAFLADYTGVAYPYPKYSQAAVDNFPWGGMENISATTLTPLILTDELGRPDVRPTQLIAHEAAHQWFGNLVTCADWSQLWLNEGFASYFALLYLGATRGEEAFRCELLAAQEAYLNEDVGAARRATIERVWKEPDDVFDTRPYQGAAARLHLLRHEVGEEAFRAGIRAYLGEHRGRSVVTADFRRAVEHAAGCDLGAFFEQWFARAGFPEFALAWEWDPERGLARLEVEQTQPSAARTPEVFELALDVEFGLEPARVVRIEIDERAEHFEFPLPARPAYVVFDRGGFVPKRVQEEKELAEWLAVAQRCSDSGARRDAVKALGRWAGATRAEVAERARDELAVRLSADPAPHVRVAAATALGGLAQAEEALRRAVLGDPDVRVQAATLGALGALGADDGRASLAEDVFVTGASYAVRAAAAGLFCRADPARAFEFVKRALELDSPHDALAGGLLRVLATLPDARVADALRAFAADAARAPTARAVAVEQLGALTRERAQNARFLEGFLTEPSFHLRQATVAALVALGDAGARSALTAYYPRSRTALERRWIESFLERSEP
jgi:aminopeptidase N